MMRFGLVTKVANRVAKKLKEIKVKMRKVYLSHLLKTFFFVLVSFRTIWLSVELSSSIVAYTTIANPKVITQKNTIHTYLSNFAQVSSGCY